MNVISGRYKPKAGKLFYKGNDITGVHPNKSPGLGIGRTFQNLALFNHMTVLENIYVGRHHLLKNSFLSGAIYWFLGSQKEEIILFIGTLENAKTVYSFKSSKSFGYNL